MAELQNTVINGTLQIEKRAQMTPLAASNTAFDSARLMRIGNTVQIAIAGSLNDTDGIASWNGAIMTTIPEIIQAICLNLIRRLANTKLIPLIINNNKNKYVPKPNKKLGIKVSVLAT